MKIYLAAPYAVRDILRSYAYDLEARHGHECTSSWLKADHKIEPGTLGTSPASSDEYARQHVKLDIEDVFRSDVLVLFTWATSQSMGSDLELGVNSGGRHVETGVALAAHIPVIVFGEPENIFHRGDGVVVINSWQKVLEALTWDLNRIAYNL